MAYNIIFYIKADALHPLAWLDLGSEEVNRLVVARFQAGDIIKFNGNEISPDAIERIEIRLTPQNSRERIPVLIAQQLDASEGSKTPELRFASEGNDVTAQFPLILGHHRGKTTGQYSKEKTIFVAYGRDESKRLNLFRFLWAVGLHPLEWQQAANATAKATPPTMEIILAGLRAAQAMVILLTPDDEARLHERFRKRDDPAFEISLTGQARQNVIFEAGMAWAMDSQRTIITEIGAVRPFSDLAGINIVKLDNTPERRHAFVERLRLAGCLVDTSGNDWLTTNVADFERDGEER